MIAHLVVGPEGHGVTRCALDLHDTAALRDEPLVRVLDGTSGDLAGISLPGRVSVHVHVTDRLFGRSAPEAADRLEPLLRAHPTTVTLHDVPQPSDGEGAHPRRADAYARIVDAARGVVVSSEHEALLLDDALALAGRSDLTGRARAVIPLPIDPPAQLPAPRPEKPSDHRDLAVLGYLYPGKGHEEALAVLPALPPDVRLLALGRPSPGHEDLADEIARAATQLGRRAVVTGFVPDAELTERLRTVAVPVAPHRHLSASGSINTWLSAGRRPLVPRSRYVDELERRCPGALFVYDDLAEAAARALAEPDLTWLSGDVRLGPSTEQTGRRYAETLRGWHA
ncbi:hypothetical protein [Arsenicicoccus dermatophilus]|uniref:hypothetical protein n=1 Tax=Arsenicicoccus dermatophilus TaxID=1076331 RepID=UPI001F4CE562|nr:hypothetical protein [Arsenicicoccus dermatophilus]MCH8611941.1 hypothetical protein [Arsenicicoccus dermatophilus]